MKVYPQNKSQLKKNGNFTIVNKNSENIPIYEKGKWINGVI